MSITKKISKLCLVCIMSFMCIVQFNIMDVRAAGFSISASSSTIEVGTSVTITVSVNGLRGRFDVSGAASDSFWADGEASKSYTVTGSSVGTISAKVVASTASDDNGDLLNGGKPVEKAVIINVVAPTSNPGGNNGGSGESNTPTNPTTPTEKKSSDANLSELSISSGELNPAFSADVTNYSVTLGKDVTSVSVNAKANDSKATVSGTGEQALKAGKNELNVNCKAEDGTVKTYIIVVNIDETPDTFIEYNGGKLGVVKNLDDVTAPDGFEKVKVTLDGKEVDAWTNNLSKLTIVYMINEKDEKNFYLYDTEKKTITSIYNPMALLGKNIAIIDIPEELKTRTGMTFGEVVVDEQKLQGWMFENKAFENYSLIYVLDEKGQARYYLYEKSENTLQLYNGAAAITQDDYETMISDHDSSLQQRMWMIFALLATNIITVILLVVMFVKRKKRKAVKNIEPPRKLHTEQFEEELDVNDDVEDTSLHITPYQDNSELFHEIDEEKSVDVAIEDMDFKE